MTHETPTHADIQAAVAETRAEVRALKESLASDQKRQDDYLAQHREALNNELQHIRASVSVNGGRVAKIEDQTKQIDDKIDAVDTKVTTLVTELTTGRILRRFMMAVIVAFATVGSAVVAAFEYLFNGGGTTH